MKIHLIGITILLSALLSCSLNDSTIKDLRDSRVYKTVKIGEQVWMAENLNADKFRNGDIIQEATTAEEWIKAGENNQPAWCYYENKVANGEKYGKLYNWYAVNDPRGLAPEGWHIPKYSEWDTLFKYLADGIGFEQSYEGIILATSKMISNEKWSPGKISAKCNNSSKFSALGSGSIYIGDPVNGGVVNEMNFYGLNEDAFWWTSEDESAGSATSIELNLKGDSHFGGYNYKGNGLSIRCIKD
jgi:uncharacterized protein (TIGR02145 family)